ncbi:hypothetical protein [Thermostaphylospora chromogena]|uniref:Uncharacterized protein n=1 Tax=Thermostaphylospora chromogena TaxID=35622 RepID=A0A1H1AY31_9ACTN|nr:hypothetical protein [Thermostaphylospora chromogena]SDQ44574.1 hypothetical protein SAMN04489764_0706 [Thermostaphylospora chromogena]
MSEMDVSGDAVDEQMLDDEHAPSDDIGVEASEADAAEQHRPVHSGAASWRIQEIPLEADPADAADQSWQVDLDEDDYR